MTSEVDMVRDRFRRAGLDAEADVLSAVSIMFSKAGIPESLDSLLPSDTPTVYDIEGLDSVTLPLETAVSSEDEAMWQKQADRLIRLRFHESLRMTEKEYRASLPPFKPQPQELRGSFNIPLLVDPRISLRNQLRLYREGLGLVIFLVSPQAVNNLGEGRPEEPYQIWANNGSRNAGRTSREVNSQLRSGEIGLNTIEGLAMIREHPEILRDRYVLQLPGSTFVDRAWPHNEPQVTYITGKPDHPRLNTRFDRASHRMGHATGVIVS